jgi:NAD(P) transhydrogenase subunit alpha
MLAESSTWMFANNVYNFVSYIAKNGVVSLERGDEIIEGVLTTIDGRIVHKGTLEAMGVL